MQNKFTIRKATPDDLNRMADLLYELFSIEKDFTQDKAKQLRGLTTLMRCGTAAVWVAEQEGEVAGMITAQMNISTAEGAFSALLEDLIVTKDRRNQGIGTKLLQTAVSWSEFKGAKRVQLLSDRRNQPAIDFYKNEGWNLTHMIAFNRKI